MKKRNIIASCLLVGCMAMCSSCKKEDVDTHANVSNENSVIAGNRNGKLTVGDVYNYALNNQKDEIAMNVLLPILEKQINLNDANMLALYKRYLNNYFDETFYSSSAYKVNGEFSEDLLVKYLNGESYLITCGSGVTSGLLDSEKFSCDYSDYISKDVKYDIYMKMLKVKYIIDEKENLIDKNDARRVTYYKVAKGSNDNEVREKLEEQVASIQTNHGSTDETLIRSIADVAEDARKKDLEKIAEEYAYLSTSHDSSSSYTYLNKFTTCGEKRCSIEEGKEYQEKLIMDKEYYSTEVVIKNNTTILYEAARNLLFSENVADYLYKIGDGESSVYYLMSPAYADQEDKRINDIIHYDASTNNYYLVIVDTIDSNSSFDDKVSVAEQLIDKISDSTIYDYCYDNLDVEIYDKDIKEYFESKYGNIEAGE